MLTSTKEKAEVMLQASEGKTVYSKYHNTVNDHLVSWQRETIPYWDWSKYVYTTNPNEEKVGTIVCKDCRFFNSGEYTCKSNPVLIYLPTRVKKEQRNVRQKNCANNCSEFKESFFSKFRRFISEMLTFN